MKSIILSSLGFDNDKIIRKIEKIRKKNIYEIKMLVVPTARRKIYNKDKYLKDYIKIGFNPKNVCFFDDQEPELSMNLDIDIIYVCRRKYIYIKKIFMEVRI